MNSSFAPWPNRSLRTLVLDDDRRWRELVAFNVEMQLGIPPALASNGKDALEILDESPIDLVVSDLIMPEMDGLQFMKRARLRYPRTKIILLSADFDAFPVPPRRLIELGAIAAISKADIAPTLGNLLRILQEATMTEWLGMTERQLVNPRNWTT